MRTQGQEAGFEPVISDKDMANLKFGNCCNSSEVLGVLKKMSRSELGLVNWPNLPHLNIGIIKWLVGQDSMSPPWTYAGKLAMNNEMTGTVAETWMELVGSRICEDAETIKYNGQDCLHVMSRMEVEVRSTWAQYFWREYKKARRRYDKKETTKDLALLLGLQSLLAYLPNLPANIILGLARGASRIGDEREKKETFGS